jgi:C4-dicarboxylate transporter, DctQ subunit
LHLSRRQLVLGEVERVTRFLGFLDAAFQKLERNFLAWAIIFSSLLLFVNVVMRYIFLLPIYWAEELSRYLMVWVIFIGASQVTLKGGGHIAVDIVPRLLSPRANKILSFLVNLIGIFFTLVLIYFSFRQMMRVKIAHQVSPAMELPMWIAYLSIPLGMFFMLIRYIQQMVFRLQGKTVEIQEVLD